MTIEPPKPCRKRTWLWVVFALSLSTCTTTVAPDPDSDLYVHRVATVEVSPALVALRDGASRQLTTTLKDANGATLTDRVVSWESSDSRKATVSGSGLVTAIAEGTATITAKVEGASGTTSVTVSLRPVAAVTVAPATSRLFVEASRQLSVTATDSAGATLTGRVVSWEISDPMRASVSSNGVVKALAPEGTATITATVGGKKSTAAVQFGSWNMVDAGAVHTCALTSDGTAYCWGQNAFGQLGDGSTTIRWVPTAVVGGVRFQSVTAGGFYSPSFPYVEHTCGLTSAGVAYCWGSNASGQLGDGTTTNRSVPTAVIGGLRFQSLTAGAVHTCGVTTAGAAYCWGGNPGGELGDGTRTGRTAPTAVLGSLTFQSISAGGAGGGVSGGGHTCGLTSAGVAWCWGTNYWGELGNGTRGDFNETWLSPRTVVGGLAFRSIATATQEGTCGVTDMGRAYCWGYNGPGMLGNGKTGQSAYEPAPSAVIGGLTFQSVAPGGNHTCGLTTSGSAYCWGFDGSGQLGTGTLTPNTNFPAPRAVAGGLRFTSITSGRDHSCGLTTGGGLHCWGMGSGPPDGGGSPVNSPTPTAVSP
jgi:alpha-tubulin suppressor-like RCC1 family protein